jgi:hypothetical protein
MVCPLKPKQNSSDTLLDQQLLSQMEDEIIRWLIDYSERNHCKFQAAGIGVEEGDLIEGDYSGKVYLRRRTRIGRLKLPSRLWLELDILPFLVHARGNDIDERACTAVLKALMYMNNAVVLNISRVFVGYRHQVLLKYK